jgi:TMEM175 potassium channel family protein
VSTGRLESFSDGVIAVAITLLVLNIQVPSFEETAKYGLGGALFRNWPVYAAYVVSFLTIGIIWVNHHVMIARLRETDRMILLLNLLLLMSIAVLPFATSLVAKYLKQSNGQHLAAAIYSGAFLVMSIFFSLLNAHILLAKHHRLAKPLPLERRQRILARSVSGVVPYAVATAVAALSAYASLIICAAIAVFYASPLGSGGADSI